MTRPVVVQPRLLDAPERADPVAEAVAAADTTARAWDALGPRIREGKRP